MIGNGDVGLEPHRLAETPPPNSFLHGLQKVVALNLFRWLLPRRVSRGTAVMLRSQCRKKGFKISRDDLLDPDEFENGMFRFFPPRRRWNGHQLR